MDARKVAKSALGVFGAGMAIALAIYGTYVGITWYGYGRSQEASDEADPLLDRFLPRYEVAERHHIVVRAPPEIALAAATDVDFEQSPVIRTILKTRELVLGGEGPRVARAGLLAQTKALGWGMLVEIPGREIVMGAVTQPWASHVVFRAVPADEFAAFDEPGYVKIVWTLRADPLGSGGKSMFRTETRAATTDPVARRKFRRYWAFFSPGIILIRRMLLAELQVEAEYRAMAS